METLGFLGFLTFLVAAPWAGIALLRKKNAKTVGIVAGVAFGVFVIGTVGSSGTDPSEDSASVSEAPSQSASPATQEPEATATIAPTATLEPSPTLAPTITAIQVSNETKEIAVIGITGYDLVQDAAITQDGSLLSLVLVVGYAVNEEHAKELGENFVRMVKAFSQDESPTKTVGTGIYDYLVGVYHPNQEQIALGAKVRIADRITW